MGPPSRPPSSAEVAEFNMLRGVRRDFVAAVRSAPAQVQEAEEETTENGLKPEH